jgi:hypothetical protein
MIDRALFGFLALIHLLPALAAIMPSQIARLYGVEATDNTLITLLQHRAVLLGLIGCVCVAALFNPGGTVAWHAVLLAGASMTAFLLIAGFNRELAGSLKKIAIVDAIGFIPLIILFFRQPWARTL